MAVLITSPIPESNFEIIRNQLAVVLATELPAQWLLDNTLLKVERVWVERFIPFDSGTELPTAVVTMDSATWMDHNQRSVRGEYLYSIVLYGNAVATGPDTTERGDVRAMVRLQRLVGVVRGILQCPAYNTLGLQPGTIAGVQVQSAVVGQKSAASGLAPDKDGMHDVVAELKVLVRSGENNIITATPVPLQQATTTITLLTNDLQQSDKGFYYDFNTVA